MKVIQTVSLKLHNPSAQKKAALELAFSRYRRALDRLLTEAAAEAQPLAAADKSTQAAFISQFVSRRDVLGSLNDYCAQPFKDSIKKHFAAIMTRWFTFKKAQEDLSYPIIRSHFRQLQFCRCSASRDFCLLYDTQKKRYYAKLHLLCHSDPPFPMPEMIIPSRFQMIGGQIKLISAAPRFMLVPLSFGKQQLVCLELARTGQAAIKTACLTGNGTDYYLNVAIERQTPESQEPKNTLGLSRGLQSALHLTICDAEGAIILQEPVEETDCGSNFNIDSSRCREEILHSLANRLVKKTEEYQAQILMANLAKYHDRLQYDDATPGFPVKDYLKLQAILSYKLPLAGLPPPIALSAARLYCTCPRCGQAANVNRMNADIFLCTKCGFGTGIDSVGSLNLANRLNKYREKKIPFTESEQGGQYEYSNKRFGINILLPGREEFEKYLTTLRDSAQYDRKLAPLIKRLQTAPQIVDSIEINTDN